MEPDNQIGTVVTKRGWQLRWGHILLALFVIVLIIIAYVVVHQIRTADHASQTCLTTNSCSNGAGNNKKSSSANKAPAATPKPSQKSSTPSNPSANNSKASSPTNVNSSNPSPTSTNTNSSTNSATSNNSTSTSNSSALANTGPGDTIGLFVAVTVAATGLHYLYAKRRLRLAE